MESESSSGLGEVGLTIGGLEVLLDCLLEKGFSADGLEVGLHRVEIDLNLGSTDFLGNATIPEDLDDPGFDGLVEVGLAVHLFDETVLACGGLRIVGVENLAQKEGATGLSGEGNVIEFVSGVVGLDFDRHLGCVVVSDRVGLGHGRVVFHSSCS